MNQKQARVREEERGFYERFVQLCDEAPRESFAQPEPPEPDIVVSSSPRLGVEIRRLILSHERRQREGTEDKIVLAAQELYESKGRPPIAVTIFWNRYGDLAALRRQQLAEQIEHFVSKLNLQIGDTYSPTPQACDLGAEEISAISLNRMIDYDDNLWYSSRSAWVPDLTEEDLLPLIEEKTEKHRKYNGVCGERWLLLVAESPYTATWYSTKAGAPIVAPLGVFDRVYILGTLDSVVDRVT